MCKQSNNIDDDDDDDDNPIIKKEKKKSWVKRSVPELELGVLASLFVQENQRSPREQTHPPQKELAYTHQHQSYLKFQVVQLLSRIKKERTEVIQMVDKYTFHQGPWEDLMLSQTERAQHLLTRLVAHKEHWSHHWELSVLPAPLSQCPEQGGRQTVENFKCINNSISIGRKYPKKKQKKKKSARKMLEVPSLNELPWSNA